MIVVIEGADGVGKTAVAAEVAKVMNARTIAFPCDEAYTGPAIREYLARRWWVDRPGTHAHEKDDRLSALAFQSLQVANRMEVMPRLHRARRAGDNLVLARYWQSGWVYGQLDGLSRDWLERVHECMVQADVNVLLDAPAEVCAERRARRDEAPERYEGRLDFTRSVVDLYSELWRSRSGWVVVDATQPLEWVVADVLQACVVVR